MVLIALYIAIGSGKPEVREFFEMNELAFFSTWPLKILMGLLVVNLAVVTWNRIPFTPPRYGVWCIHAGIITLILGMGIYYNRKFEGHVRLFVDPRDGAVEQESFYDAFERALYVRVADRLWNWYALPGLPRFRAYDDALGNAGWLTKRAGLRDIALTRSFKHDGKVEAEKVPGVSGDLRVDVVGYWPYATVQTTFNEAKEGGVPAVRVTMPGVHGGGSEAPESWLVASEPRNAVATIEGTELEHRHRPADMIAAMKQAASRVHRIEVRLSNHQETIWVEPGKSYTLGASGYSIAVENYQPAWPMFGTNEIVRALTLKVKSPTMEFRRMILDGKELQTDFKLGEEGGGPMGKRQKEPLDKALLLGYRVEDPFRLMPRDGTVKHTIVTEAGGKSMAEIVTGLSRASSFRDFPTGVGEIEVTPGEMGGPFAAAHGAGDGHDHASFKVALERKDHVQRNDEVTPVPPAQRRREFGESGTFQVIKCRVRVGDWSREVLVPYSEDTAETGWDGGNIELPGGVPLRLQLGRNRLPLPNHVKVALKNFEAVPYPGAEADEGAMMREFRSTVVITDPATGEQTTGVAHLNNPIYFDGGRYLFFQASYDGQGRRWTALGVGNRPGVWIMTLGSIMFFVGLLYAFYVKPILVRRMKDRAIEQAKQRPAVREKKAAELVSEGV